MIEHNITISRNAIERVKAIMCEDDQQDMFLRISLNSGGCAGFQYNFNFDNIKNDTDFIVEEEGVEFVLDESCFPMLNNATIDFTSDLTGSQFLITVPGAKTCGCGSSFII